MEPAFLGRIKKPRFFADTAVNVQEHCRRFADVVGKDIIYTKTRPALQGVMGIAMDMPGDAVEEVASICSVDLLNCPGEPKTPSQEELNAPLPVHAGIATSSSSFPNLIKGVIWNPSLEGMDPSAVEKLETLKAQKRKLESGENQEKIRNKNLRYLSEIRLESELVQNLKSFKTPMRNLDMSQPVVVVRVYQPVSLVHQNPQSGRTGFVLSQEFFCLGHNRLSELRDLIVCPNDTLTVNDCRTQAPCPAKPVRAKEVYPSGMFCISGDFFVDTRNPKSSDYSEPIRAWAKDRELPVGQVKPMETATFAELTVRVGYPYAYVHQGNCHHPLIVSDIRLFHPTNERDSSRYPIVAAIRKRLGDVCQICETYLASWITEKHQLTPTDPTFFCTRCFRGFNYNISNRRTADFTAYHHPNVLYMQPRLLSQPPRAEDSSKT